MKSNKTKNAASPVKASKGRSPTQPTDWRGIGRSLVVFVGGPEDVAVELSKDPDVAVVHFDGTAGEIARLTALRPELVDVVVLGIPRGRETETLSLAHTLRGRLLGVVFMLPPDAVGDAILRHHLGAFRHSDGIVRSQLWNMVAVAAQETWALAWTQLSRNAPRASIKEGFNDAGPTQPMMETAQLPRALRPAPVSRTAPWSPPPELLVELTKAYRER